MSRAVWMCSRVERVVQAGAESEHVCGVSNRAEGPTGALF